jgi:hypothetical protein
MTATDVAADLAITRLPRARVPQSAAPEANRSR